MNWQDIENKYGVSFVFINNDGLEEIKPVDEWLDDVYLHLTADQALCLMRDIYDNAEELFKYYITHEE